MRSPARGRVIATGVTGAVLALAGCGGDDGPTRPNTDQPFADLANFQNVFFTTQGDFDTVNNELVMTVAAQNSQQVAQIFLVRGGDCLILPRAYASDDFSQTPLWDMADGATCPTEPEEFPVGPEATESITRRFSVPLAPGSYWFTSGMVINDQPIQLIAGPVSIM